MRSLATQPSACKAISSLAAVTVDLDIKETGNVCVLKVKGALKYGEPVTQFDQAVAATLNSGHVYLVLDLSSMPVIDSCGIGAIVNALRNSKELGGDAKLVSPSPFALKTFKMMGILPLFQMFSDETEAIAAAN
jgi:anti-anti-sigma factor